jgi:hypothetical protein
MIIYPSGTKVWYKKLDGTRVRGRVIGPYDGPEKWLAGYMVVELPSENDPGPSVVPSTRLTIRDDDDWDNACHGCGYMPQYCECGK